jgi:hypothetical protein
MNFIRYFTSLFTLRSGQWQTVRKYFLVEHTSCEGCGATKRLEAHHCVPYHLDKAKELDPDNLICLCRRCHLFIGHLDNWGSYNPMVREDAALWLEKIKKRV